MELDAPFEDVQDGGQAAWGLAMSIEVDAGLGELRPTFDELADAMLVWTGDPETEVLSARVLETIWSPALESAIRGALEGLVADSADWGREAELALADLGQRGPGSEIAHAVVQRVAMDLSIEDSGSFLCLCCLDEWIGKAPAEERRRIALQAGLLACRDAAVPPAELRAAFREAVVSRSAGGNKQIARLLATDARRRAVRARFGRIARLGRTSMSALSGELTLLLDGGLPSDPDEDELWQATCVALVDRLDADAN